MQRESQRSIAAASAGEAQATDVKPMLFNRMRPRSSQDGGPQPPEHVLRVLLVEDSPLLVQRIVELVSELPNVRLVDTAGSESEAMSRIDAGNIDAVILDLQLHTGSGFGVLRALHARAEAPPVIVITNFAITAYRYRALALGATHILDKSRDYDRLPGVLRELSDALH
jgi:DNA-binding NarL/FixJ family response regulator